MVLTSSTAYLLLFHLQVGTAIVCPNSSFTPLGTFCAMFMGSTLYNKTQAQKVCQAVNSTLPTFLDLTEQTALSNFVPTVTSSRPWLGYNNNGTNNGSADPGSWYDWSGKTCLYIKWGSGEPNGYGSALCTDMYNYNGVYAVNDEACSNTYQVICIWRPYPIPSNCITTTTLTTTTTRKTSSTSTTPTTTTYTSPITTTTSTSTSSTTPTSTTTSTTPTTTTTSTTPTTTTTSTTPTTTTTSTTTTTTITSTTPTTTTTSTNPTTTITSTTPTTTTTPIILSSSTVPSTSDPIQNNLPTSAIDSPISVTIELSSDSAAPVADSSMVTTATTSPISSEITSSAEVSSTSVNNLQKGTSNSKRDNKGKRFGLVVGITCTATLIFCASCITAVVICTKKKREHQKAKSVGSQT